MATYYLVDYESVNNSGIENITTLTTNEHIHIFYSDDAKNSNFDIMFAKNIDIEVHKVKKMKKGDQSLDKHLVSYLGYLLGLKGKVCACACVIVSKDKGYDETIKFWKNEGFENISRIEKIPVSKKTKITETKQVKSTTNSQTQNAKIAKSLDAIVSGDDRTELNTFVQHKLKEIGYGSRAYNRICKYVVKCSSSEKQLSELHNMISKDFDEDKVKEIYDDVKHILEEYSKQHDIDKKKNDQIRSFYGRHFKKKPYVENKEATIEVLLKAKDLKDVNNGLLKIYMDGKVVRAMKETLKPLLDVILK